MKLVTVTLAQDCFLLRHNATADYKKVNKCLGTLMGSGSLGMELVSLFYTL